MLASVITAPAPNAGAVLSHDSGEASEIERYLKRRAAMVLAIAGDRGVRRLILGAWGIILLAFNLVGPCAYHPCLANFLDGLVPALAIAPHHQNMDTKLRQFISRCPANTARSSCNKRCRGIDTHLRFPFQFGAEDYCLRDIDVRPQTLEPESF